MPKRYICFLCGMLLLLSGALLADSFPVGDIRVQGLKRASLGAVLNNLPIRIGDTFDENDTPELISALYDTGLFDDIAINRSGNILYIRVVERPGIAEIEIDGPEQAKTALPEVLKAEGIAVGRIFQRTLAERLQDEIQQQYYAIGRYGTKISVEAIELEGRRVKLLITIRESEVAKISAFRLKGNSRFSTEEILDVVESKPTAWYDFFGDDEYSRLKLSADMDAIRKLYFDNGYLDFTLSTVRVSMDPKQESIYIDVEMIEGRRYSIDKTRIGGDIPVPKKELFDLVILKKGEIFSRAAALAAARRMEGRLASAGYAFATVNMVPEPESAKAKVDLNYIVESGRKIYVRRINIKGNTGTSDEVYRREMRQMESAPYDKSKIELSKRRLRRLPYIESAEIDDVRLSGVDDQVDLDVNVAERLSGYYNLGLGLSNAEGAVLSFQINQDNFLGSGNRVGVAFSNSKVNTRYALNFFDPYYTAEGVSRLLAFSYRSVDYDEDDIVAVETDEVRAEFGLGLPITENDTLGLGLTVQSISLDIPESSTGATIVASSDIREFVDREGEDFFNPLILSVGVRFDARDRSLFPTEGARINTNVTLFSPIINDLNYIKFNYDHQHYIPLNEARDYVLFLRGWLSYAKAFGDTNEVPFYDKLYAGGSNSVRGYRNNSLGPRDLNDVPLGGDLRLIGTSELFVPSEWLYDPARLRLGLFADVGNVFDEDDINLGDLRGAYGLHIQWLTAIGGISFSFANNFNDESGDETEGFSFDLGTRF